MKPMKVEAGQNAPDVDELIKQANELIVKVDKETKDFGTESADLFANVTGVEPVRTGYYDTNQRRITVEDVKNQGAKMEKNSKLKTHSGYPNVVEMRENKAGDPSDGNPESAYTITDYS